MEVRIAEYISLKIFKAKNKVFRSVDSILKSTFRDLSFGKGIGELYIGIMCADPPFTFDDRLKFTKGGKVIQIEGKQVETENALEFNIEIPEAFLLSLSDSESVSHLLNEIYLSLDRIRESKKVTNFDLDEFKVVFKAEVLDLYLPGELN